MRLLLLLLRRQPSVSHLSAHLPLTAATPPPQHTPSGLRARALSSAAAPDPGSGEGSPRQRKVREAAAAEPSPVSADGAASAPAAAAAAQEQQASLDTKTPSSSAVAVAGTTQLVAPGLVAEFSGTLNRLTGYEGIDHLKGRVADVDASLTAAKQQLSAAKRDYDTQLGEQVQLHREVTALLQRKSAWVPADVARFTELYAAEHANEQAVAAAKARYSALGDEVDSLQLRLVDLIRERYQQEQLWSDKIRRASTWWTWGLMGLHFASFMAVYTFIEPRKRAAMTAAVAGMLQQHTASLDDKLAHLVAAPGVAAAAGRSGGQQQQQQPSPDAGPQLQQQVLAELQRVQHQLQALQQQLPQHAQPAATAAAQGAGAAVKADAQGRQWRVPGSAWASRQLAAAGSLAHQGWSVTKAKAQDVGAHFRVLQELAAHGQQQQQQPEEEEPSVVPAVPAAATAATAASDSSRQDQQQPQQGGAAAPQPGSSLGGGGLWQQLRGSGSVVHITKGQLAAVGAAASAAGAGLAALVLLALSGGSRGAGAP